MEYNISYNKSVTVVGLDSKTKELKSITTSGSITRGVKAENIQMLLLLVFGKSNINLEHKGFTSNMKVIHATRTNSFIYPVFEEYMIITDLNIMETQ